MVTFAVDDVTPAAATLPTVPLADLYPDAHFVGGDPATPVLASNGVHPLLRAVGCAFAEHRPLVLSPDAVWLTVTQGIARHVRLFPEQSRARLVAHRGRERLTVTVDGPMPRDRSSWGDAIASFHKMLADRSVGSELFDCDFSTSTDVERIAGRVVALDAYSPYFTQVMICVCGIPSVTVTGTVEDWRRIRDRIDLVAATFGLQIWCRSLAPIADQFVLAASGRADRAFWQRIYNPVDAYGGRVVTGWIARLYPYLRRDGVVATPNPLLDLPIGEPRDLTFDNGLYRGPGIRTDTVPDALARAVVGVNDRVSGTNHAVAMHAGLVGVAQDRDGALRPIAGWHLSPSAVEINEVIDRIVRDHVTSPPEPGGFPALAAAADLTALYHRIGDATLFDGAWRILPETGHRTVWHGYGSTSVIGIIDLGDGRHLAAVNDLGDEDAAEEAFFDMAMTTYWVICRIARNPEQHGKPYVLLDDPADLPVYGTSLALLLDAALDSNGDIAHLHTGRLGPPPR